MKHFTIVALSVLTLCLAAQPIAVHAAGQATAKAMTASGVVKSVSGSALVVTSAGKELSFVLDGTTKFTGKGLSTKSKGQPMAATDAVHQNDTVKVTYHDMGGTLHAASVSITATGTGKK